MENSNRKNMVTENICKKNKIVKNIIMFFSFILIGASLTLGGCKGNDKTPGQAAKENTGNVSNASGTGKESGNAGESGTDEKDEGSRDDSTNEVDGNSDDGTAEEKTEVRREDFPDCDGSGHGYYEIHYSDGSTEIEEY